MAVGVGFEPTEGSLLNGFQDRRFRPLSQPTNIPTASTSCAGSAHYNDADAARKGLSAMNCFFIAMSRI